MKTIFKNELNNEITIQVSKLPEEYYFIGIYGPNSNSTNTITKKEFVELRNLLDKFEV